MSCRREASCVSGGGGRKSSIDRARTRNNATRRVSRTEKKKLFGASGHPPVRQRRGFSRGTESDLSRTFRRSTEAPRCTTETSSALALALDLASSSFVAASEAFRPSRSSTACEGGARGARTSDLKQQRWALLESWRGAIARRDATRVDASRREGGVVSDRDAGERARNGREIVCTTAERAPCPFRARARVPWRAPPRAWRSAAPWPDSGARRSRRQPPPAP